MGETTLLQVSNLCLDRTDIGLSNVGVHMDRLAEFQGNEPDGGFPGGYVITPTRALAASLEYRIQRGTFNNVLEGPQAEPTRVFASGTEQSWGPGLPEGLGRAAASLNRPGAAIELAGRAAALTESHRSLSVMQRVDAALGSPLAVVRAEIPHDGSLVDFGPYGFRRTGVQIKPGLYMHLAGVQPDTDGFLRPTKGDQARLFRALQKQGVNGVVLDSHWVQAEAEQHKGVRLHPDVWEDPSTSFWTETSAGAGVPIMGLHFAVGRVDSKHPDDKRRTMEELEATLRGPEAIASTRLGEIVFAGYRAWRRQLREAWKFNLIMAELDRTGDVDPASMREIEGQMLGIVSPIRLPVTVEIPHDGLRRHQEERGARKFTRADAAAMLQVVAANVSAYLATLEKPEAYDSTPQRAGEILAGIAARRQSQAAG